MRLAFIITLLCVLFSVSVTSPHFWPPKTIANNFSNSYNKSQRDELFLSFGKEIYKFLRDSLSIIRSLNTVVTATGISHASYVVSLIARSEWSWFTCVASRHSI